MQPSKRPDVEGHAEYPRGSLTEGYPGLKRRLSICSALIFDSSVDAGTPSRPAAPNGPATRPLLCVSAALMASFSWVASVPVEGLATSAIPRVRAERQCGTR